MKLLKKYLFVAGIFTVFLLAPLSVQIQSNPLTNQENIGFTQKKFNIDLVKVKISKAYATEEIDPETNHLSCKPLDFACYGINLLHILFIDVGNYIVGLSAKFMDFFLSHSLQSSSYNGSDFIKQGWEILRDITNIVFIFALLYIAFQMVLGIGKGKAKKYLIKVILITLTINFSLFFSYAIIDVSNIFAHVFYNKIDQAEVTFQETEADVGNITGGIHGKSTSLAIANKINPQKLFLSNPTPTKGERMLMVVMAGIINGAMIYVFLSVAFLFLGRTLGLWIAAILSPLAFASLTVPKMENIQYIGFNKWFKSLLAMAFMAPIFIFILYLAVQFMNVYTIGGNPSTLQNTLDIIMPMAMIVVLLLLAKKVAEKMSGDFAGVISGFVGKFVGGALAIGAVAATGGAAAASGLAGAGRSAVGQGMKKWGGEKYAARGEKMIKRGQRMRSTKILDVTKIPGFKKILPKELKRSSDFFSKNLAGKSIRGGERKVILGARDLKEKYGDMKRGGKDFTESEAKFEREEDKYRKEQEKRKEGAATWQDKLVKEKEQSELKDAKNNADSARAKAEKPKEKELQEAKQTQASEDARRNQGGQFDALAGILERKHEEQKKLQEELNKNIKEQKSGTIGFGVDRSKQSKLEVKIQKQQKDMEKLDKEINLNVSKEEAMSSNYKMAKREVGRLSLEKKQAGDSAVKKSRKESAKKLTDRDPSAENQRTANKIIEDKGLKTKEEKFMEKIAKQMKENEE